VTRSPWALQTIKSRLVSHLIHFWQNEEEFEREFAFSTLGRERIPVLRSVRT